MPQSIVYKFAGPTVGITVSTVASAGVSVSAAQGINDVVNYAAFLNTGTTLAAVTLGNPPPTPSFPVTTVTATLVQATSFILGANMQQPQIVAVPAVNNAFSFAAITNSAVSPVLYVTPVIST